MNSNKKYALLIAIIFSVIVHFVLINNISFNIFKLNNKDYENIEITIVKPETKLTANKLQNSSNVKKENSKIIRPIEYNKKDNPNNDIQNKSKGNEKEIITPKKIIDTSKILSQIKDMNFLSNADISQKKQRVKTISANTTDYLYKLYFESWRQKVEKIGAMNYPREASELGMFGSLRLTVSLDSDGMIKDLYINKSSGHKKLDEAALNIVKLGEPYAKFPAEILKEVDIINITRKWKFTEKSGFSK